LDVPSINKIAMITGATSGIGRETALALGSMGLELVLVGRSDERLRAVSEEITRTTGNQAVQTMRGDLSSMQEVRRLTTEFKSSHNKLDVLINNAGLILGKRELTTDGHEYTFALDHLAPFLMTNLLLDHLKRGAPSKVITVSSSAHRMGRMQFDDLMLEKGWTSFKAYGQAKLANALFTYELARRLNGTKVTSNCLHPGVVRTNVGRELGGATRLVAITVIRPFAISPQKGARTPIYLATSPEVENVSGKYFVRCKPSRSSRESHNVDEAKRLWEASEKLTGMKI
jgi:NAD(P)-dependent dehydrogenase (short-subunit alcohol dehydrogenase family)